MRGVAEIYTLTLYDNFRPLYGNWQPDRSLKLGDFGLVDTRRQFQPLGNVEADRGLKVTARKNADKPFQMYFASQGLAQVKLNARGETTAVNPVAARASLEVTFSGAEAVFFNAAECASSAVANKAALGDQIMELYEQGKWQAEWALVTDLVEAGATTLAISGSSSASILFGATSDVPQIDLAKASIGLGLATSTNVGFQMASQKGLTPLFGLCKIQGRFPLFWQKEVSPLSMIGAGDLHETLEPFRPLSATRETDLVFSQLL